MPAHHLMVEGRDDWFVIKNLLMAHGVTVRDRSQTEAELQFPEGTVVVGFSAYGERGITELLASLPARLKQSELRRLIVVVDADTDLAARWQSLRNIVIKAGAISPPEAPHPGGTVIAMPGGAAVGIWLMPDNAVPGMLEDFVRLLVPADDVLLPHVERFLEAVKPCPRRFPDAHRAKAAIHSWLAVQPEPGKPLGVAILSRFLNPQEERCQPFLTWLRAMLLGS